MNNGLLLLGAGRAGSPHVVTVSQTAGSGLMITVQVSWTGADPRDVVINWGDGTEEYDPGVSPRPVSASHTYAAAGTYTVRATLDTATGLGGPTGTLGVTVAAGYSPLDKAPTLYAASRLAPISGGTWADQSGNGNDLTTAGTAPTAGTAAWGPAVTFNGSTQTRLASPNVFSGTSVFTLSYLTSLFATGNDGIEASLGDDAAYLMRYNTELVEQFGGNASSIGGQAEPSLVVCVSDGSRVWSVLVGVTDFAMVSKAVGPNLTGKLCIGAQSSNANKYKGSLDEVVLKLGQAWVTTDLNTQVNFLADMIGVSAFGVQIFCLGHSLTAGVGASNEMTYPEQLRGLLGVGYATCNLGVSGQVVSETDTYGTTWGTPYLLDRASKRVAIFDSASNDIAAGTSAAATYAAIKAAVGHLKAGGFDRVIVLSMTTRTDVTGAKETQRVALNTLLGTGASLIAGFAYTPGTDLAAAGCDAVVRLDLDARLDPPANVDGVHYDNTQYGFKAADVKDAVDYVVGL